MMLRSYKDMPSKVGLPPGTAVYIGEAKTEKISITLIDFDENSYEILELDNVNKCAGYIEKTTTTWINICGVHDVKTIEDLSGIFQLHPLTIEDIVNTHQRPKIDILDNYIFVTLRLYNCDELPKLSSEQVSLVLGENYLLTFQEKHNKLFDTLLAHIKNNKTRLRKEGADYLFYSFIDIAVDSYFKILDSVDSKIEYTEERINSPETLKRAHQLRKDLISLRKTIWPLREILYTLTPNEAHLIKEATIVYLKDVSDHVNRLIDSIETLRDIISSVIELYMSSINNRLNEVMKYLAVFATIFIPLTFIASIYGMNFEYMPELKWKWGYYSVLAVMFVIGSALFYYFKKKKMF
ncbi:magnesium and cobalt transport protein CorA [Candidatus Magnetoovum chiemensis]|nr:magnesium and cobalt transport protein CorA [Candidatus Magnetoovum chiemensis]